MIYTRRQFGKLAIGTIPVVSAILTSTARTRAATKPDSKINGVLLGVIAPYSFHNMPSDAQSILDDLVQANLSAVEMQNTTVEMFAGAPLPTGRGGARGRGPLTPEQIAARKAAAQALTDWRVAASMDKYHFFFQAEDGIRDLYVTGVQTCALPISNCSLCYIFPLPRSAKIL